MARASRRCGDVVWAECAAKVGVHADGGPPALSPPPPLARAGIDTAIGNKRRPIIALNAIIDSVFFRVTLPITTSITIARWFTRISALFPEEIPVIETLHIHQKMIDERKVDQ